MLMTGGTLAYSRAGTWDSLKKLEHYCDKIIWRRSKHKKED